MRQVEVQIQKIAFGGAGFGHVDGKACFVPFTMPGDTARAVVKKEKKSYMEAELIELLVPSPERITPNCSVFGECGGCSMQQMTYHTQLAIKQELFAEQLARFAGVDRSRVSPMLPANNPFGYRTRVQIKIRSVSGRLLMGFYRAGTHVIVPFPDRCAIASPAINTIISELHFCLPQLPEPERILQVDVATGDDEQSIVIIHYHGDHPDHLSGFISAHHATLIPSVNGIWLQHRNKKNLRLISGCERLSYGISVDGSSISDTLRLFFSKGGFSQVNYLQNRHLVRIVLELSNLVGHERVLDIFCGNGNFSLPLATRAKAVVGIEEYRPSVDDARENAVCNGISNADFFCTDAASGVTELAEEGERFDVVVLDPPRSGAAEVMEHLPELKPERIVYVSCDPVTLARDVAILKKLDYCVVRSIPVDMFPQTSHMESVTLIERH